MVGLFTDDLGLGFCWIGYSAVRYPIRLPSAPAFLETEFFDSVLCLTCLFLVILNAPDDLFEKTLSILKLLFIRY